MAPHAKSRMISFRLSEEEFERFRAICFNHGVRSVSELARTAINNLLVEPAHAAPEALAWRVAELEGRIRMLGLELKRLNKNTGATRAGSVLTE